MAEYAGYIPGQSIDWLSLAKGVKADIDQGLKAREERKAADQKLVTDVASKLKGWESTQNKAFNQVVFGGLDKARNQSLEWNRQLRNGEINRAEYQMRMNNLNESFDAFSTATKNFDEYVVGINQRKQEGLSSSFEMFSANINSRLMNLGTKEMQVGESGDFFFSDADGSIQNVRNYTNMNNIVDNKIDVAKSVDQVVSKWDDVTRQTLLAGGRTVLETDPRINAAYNKTKADLVGALVDANNPRGITSILLDNSDLDYNLYYTADDARNIISKAVSNEEMALGRTMTDDEREKFSEKYFNENMIQVVQDNDGNYQPRLNDKMIADAKKVVENQIEQQLGFKREEERGFAPSGGGGRRSGGGDGSEDEVTKAGWQLSMDAINNTPIGATSASDASGILTQLGAKNPKLLFKKVKWKNNKTGIAVFEQNSKGEWESKQNILNSRDLAPYIFGTSNVDKALTSWDKANQTYGGGQTTGGTKPKAY
jgi:hypothetical protein